MGSKIGTTKLYKTGGRIVFVASGNNCPRINMTSGKALRIRDDYSTGFRANKKLFKTLFC